MVSLRGPSRVQSGHHRWSAAMISAAGCRRLRRLGAGPAGLAGLLAAPAGAAALAAGVVFSCAFPCVAAMALSSKWSTLFNHC